LLAGKIRGVHDQVWFTLACFALCLLLAWEAAERIVSNDFRFLEFIAVAALGCFALVSILRNWRVGFALFNVWVLFEDCVRKYMGNGTALFFGKDVLALVIYAALLSAIVRGREKKFRPPFRLWFPLAVFMWFAALQILNPHSPSILYGLLGFKLDFFYVPMLFVGYALIRDRQTLRAFLLGNAVLAIVISVIGIVQAIVGKGFMNPATSAPELFEMANLEKVAPISGQVLSLTNSVFVSPGRFSLYLTLAAILSIGAVGYLLLLPVKRHVLVMFSTIGLIAVATVFSGSRSALVFVSLTAIAMSLGLIWGAPWRSRLAHRILKAIGWASAIVTAGVLLAMLLYPAEVGSRIAFYAETLNPYSSASVLHFRGVTYPLQGLQTAFDDENWMFGNGLGTASLGLQYVAKLLHSDYRGKWTESGWGELILELGILGPVLWVLWSIPFLYSCWRVARRLRQTPFFPLAFAVVWFVFMILFPMTFGGTTPFQNYVDNVFLWLMVGMLYRLPELASTPEEALIPSRGRRRSFASRSWRPRLQPSYALHRNFGPNS
jgi:hypothetical protein